MTMNVLWEKIVRFRTWLFNIILALLFILPEILNSPEFLAVVPPQYQRWVLVAAFLINIWMRWRPASVASDPEVKVKNEIAKADGPVKIEVKAEGATKAVIRA